MFSSPKDWYFKEYSQEAAETPFVSVKFPVFSGPTWTVYSPLICGNMASGPMLELMSSRTRNLSLPPGNTYVFSTAATPARPAYTTGFCTILCASLPPAPKAPPSPPLLSKSKEEHPLDLRPLTPNFPTRVSGKN